VGFHCGCFHCDAPIKKTRLNNSGELARGE
jgi:hypothetical protein